MGISLEQLFQQTQLFLHGSTVAENTILTGDGSRTGLITTAGFEDTLSMTRGAYGRWGGLTEDEIKHPIMTDRPTPDRDVSELTAASRRGSTTRAPS